MLGGLSGVLAKAATDAAAQKIDPAVLLRSRLAPDMFLLVRQVQIATDAAKAGGARLAGIDTPSFPDTETSFAELEARIARTVTFLDGLYRKAIDAGADRTVAFTAGRCCS